MELNRVVSQIYCSGTSHPNELSIKWFSKLREKTILFKKIINQKKKKTNKMSKKHDENKKKKS